MSTLFFEGFNIPNNNLDIYLDPKYWSKSLTTVPYTAFLKNDTSAQKDYPAASNPSTYFHTFGYLAISGSKSFTNPPETQAYIQLSGVSGLPTSSGLYIGMRVLGLNYNPLISFPHPQKLITFCSGNNETISIEAVCVTGESSYAPNWSSSWSSQSGLGLRIVQNNTNKALYDLRMPDVSDLDIKIPGSTTGTSYGVIRRNFSNQTRTLHLEFYIKNTGLELKIEGIETKDSYTGSQGLISINSGIIDNIKLYNRIVTNEMSTTFYNNIGNGYGECGGIIGYDDISIITESGSAPNYWIGETCRIIPLRFHHNLSNVFGWPIGYMQNKVLNTGWNEYAINGDLTNILDLRDADDKNISTADSGSIYAMRPSRQQTTDYYMQKDIGGLRMFNEARKLFLNTSFVNVYGTGAGTDTNDYYPIGDIHNLTTTNYQIFNSFIMFNPVNNNPWVSGDIFRTYAGYGAFGPSGIFGVKKL